MMMMVKLICCIELFQWNPANYILFSTELIDVGYEFTVYTTSEGHPYVELCTVTVSHPGGTPRAFVITATTSDGTACMILLPVIHGHSSIP